MRYGKLQRNGRFLYTSFGSDGKNKIHVHIYKYVAITLNSLCPLVEVLHELATWPTSLNILNSISEQSGASLYSRDKST